MFRSKNTDNEEATRVALNNFDEALEKQRSPLINNVSSNRVLTRQVMEMKNRHT
jgi:enamine deaminase RidA (YjgF/YER057c/UK114 family)